MRQTVRVVENLKGGLCTVELRRESACGGNCHSCGGCASPNETIVAKAVNSIGANPGDMVVVETDRNVIFGIAALVYILPVVLLILGYILGQLLSSHPLVPGAASALAFALGVASVIFYGRLQKNRVDLKTVHYAGLEDL